jgi:hypothetical protein
MRNIGKERKMKGRRRQKKAKTTDRKKKTKMESIGNVTETENIR